MQIIQIVALLALALPVLADGAVERRYVGGPANAAALVAARAPRKDSGRILANDPAKQKEQDAITAALDAENNPQPPARAAKILGGGRKKNQKRSPEPRKDSGRILANDPSKQAEQDAITAALDAENNPQPPARAAKILEGGRKKKAN
ncbi:hypothetical protein MAPG_11425 [Magnaporthiopsis poae ATCC 64411]|uniref:Uncharacterized protein n=1 Tax=Magnaporthiopsis poae (strain ATCC 64411 / 73-15) TaxID=644358 RepID=A0A0C4EF86_MAGP6|nr:hypothetical protein MAPG_11425 [Magnaporthiopsis poae ATCC 64411]